LPQLFSTATSAKPEVDRYCRTTSQHLEAENVIADPAWEIVRNKASDFIEAFKGSWPNKPRKLFFPDCRQYGN
jgi:hypothetical protein